MNHDTVLVTGASSAIGLALAREFAQHGHPLVLVAPIAAELREVAADVGRSFGVNVRTIAKDFEHPSSVEEVFAELAADRIPIEILVNHAALGQGGRFWETPLERDIAMLRVNIEAVVRLTKAFLPVMVKRGHGRILNTASLAEPALGPRLAVYHASKAFVLSFSEAIAAELEDTAVTVTAVCPGPIDFLPPAGLIDTEEFQRDHLEGPSELARAAYAALKRGERLVVRGGTKPTQESTCARLPEPVPTKRNARLGHGVDPRPRKRETRDLETKD